MQRLLLALLLASAAACTDRQATRYVGTAMRESAPDSAGPLRLTLFTHDDSGYTGVIELGPPARGSGSAYAWHEGPALRVVTVGAETSDTIRWFSSLAGPEIGGTFEVTGGDRAGQRGTWRARLMQGPPASPATLRGPAAVPAPRLSELWPLLLVAGVIAWLTRWVRRAPRPPTMEDGAPWRAPPSRRAGLGGWLALFIYGQVVAAIVWTVRLAQTTSEYTGGIGFAAAIPGMQAVLVLETVVQLLTPLFVLIGLVLIFRRSPLAPRHWFAYLAAIAAYLLADMVLTPWIHARSAHLVGARNLEATPGGIGTPTQLRYLVVTCIWALYWVKSERVRATFGTAALDRSWVAPPSSSPFAPATDLAAARPARSWRRVALWTVAVVVALVVLVTGIALWTTRATPLEVPPGKDIRDVVAGRWTWESDSLGCRNAHTIAFADSGRVMTITSSTVADPEPVTTYDIQVLSRSTIRGAIRGETRRTDDGEPVVWDLVLTGPGEYRWRRTDWRASPWSYTGAIRRCPHAQPARGAERADST